MLRALTAVLAVFVAVLAVPVPAAAATGGPRVLVFTKAADPKQAHRSTAEAVGLLEMNARRYGFDIETTADASVFKADELAEYDVVLWLNTYGDVLNAGQQDAFESWMRDGGGFVGVHSAARTEPEWDYYHDLVGAFAVDGEGGDLAERDVTVDTEKSAAGYAPAEMDDHNDQWYTFDRDPKKLDAMQILATAPVTGDDEGSPVAWARPYAGGRSWYTSMGHAAKAYEDGNFTKLLRSGIWWAANDKEPPTVATRDAAPAWPYGLSFLAWIAAVAAGGAVAVVKLNRREALP
ncbi:MAG: ThuA domain-containing protein [Stackebrandtia sp.]